MTDTAPAAGHPFQLDQRNRAPGMGSQRHAGSGRRPNAAGQTILTAVCVGYYLLLGGPLLLVQAAFNGVSSGSLLAFSAYIGTVFALVFMRLLPLILHRSSAFGVFHPLIIYLTLWPIVRQVPLLEAHAEPLFGLLAGAPVAVPEFPSSGYLLDADVFFVLAQLQMMEAIGIGVLIFVFNLLDKKFGARGIAALPPPALSADRLRLLILAVVGLSVFAIAAFIQIRGGLTSHLASLALGRFVALEGLGPVVVIADFGLVATLVWICFNPATVKTPWFIAVLTAVALMAFIVAGSRSAFLMALIGAALAWSIRTGRVPVKTAAFAVPVLLAFYGLLLMLRTGTDQDQRAGITVFDRLSMTEVSDVYVAGSSEAALRVANRADAPVYLRGYEMTDGPLFGRTYVAMFTWFIPRAIWPDKPRGAGSFYAQTFLGVGMEGVAIPIGPVAEAYWNFWYPGVLLVYGLTGAFLFFAYYFALRYWANPFAVAAYVRFLIDFHLTAEAIVPLIHSLIALWMLWIAAKLFAHARGPVPGIAEPQVAKVPST